MVVSYQSFISVLVAGLIFSSSPGPSMLYIISRTIESGTKGGIVSAAGLASGGLCHVLLAAIGVSALIMANPHLYNAVKYIGALYLIFLGAKGLLGLFRKNQSHIDSVSVKPEHSLFKIYVQGAIIEITNPKTIIFFLSFIPQFIAPSHGHVPLQFFILGALIPITAMPADLIIALGGGKFIKRWLQNPKAELVFSIVSSLILITIGAVVIL